METERRTPNNSPRLNSPRLGSPPTMEPPAPVALGVCAELARRTGASVPMVRAGAITLATAGGLGMVLYVGAAMVWRNRTGPMKPRSVAADCGVVTLAVGVIWLFVGVWPGVHLGLVVPVGLVSLGIAMGWQNFALTATSAPHLEGGTNAPTRLRSVALRILGGVVLCIAGLALMFSHSTDLRTFRDTALALAVAFTGISLVMGPSLVTGLRSFSSERDERVRAQERSRVASHLHDSVLQTLTLIQKNASDPTEVASLARQQERSLRRWLYGGTMSYDIGSTATGENAWRAAFETMVGEVESRYGTAVELVMVGAAKTIPSETQAAVLGATREALVNASKFSGETHLSVYCELNNSGLNVFVRDRGTGFEPATVSPDRMGIRESIVSRMKSVGGHSDIRTGLGAGTEVALSVPIESDTPAQTGDPAQTVGPTQ